MYTLIFQFLNRIQTNENLEPKYGKNSPKFICTYYFSDVIVILILTILF
jgi:hypothetical protein